MIGKNSKEQCSGETVRGRWCGLGTGDSKTSSAANPKSICQCRIGEWFHEPCLWDPISFSLLFVCSHLYVVICWRLSGAPGCACGEDGTVDCDGVRVDRVCRPADSFHPRPSLKLNVGTGWKPSHFCESLRFREDHGTGTSLTPLLQARFGPGSCGPRQAIFAGHSTGSGLGPLGAAPP